MMYSDKFLNLYIEKKFIYIFIEKEEKVTHVLPLPSF